MYRSLLAELGCEFSSSLQNSILEHNKAYFCLSKKILNSAAQTFLLCAAMFGFSKRKQKTNEEVGS